jgi:hypothetical protein
MLVGPDPQATPATEPAEDDKRHAGDGGAGYRQPDESQIVLEEPDNEQDQTGQHEQNGHKQKHNITFPTGARIARP